MTNLIVQLDSFKEDLLLAVGSLLESRHAEIRLLNTRLKN